MAVLIVKQRWTGVLSFANFGLDFSPRRNDNCRELEVQGRIDKENPEADWDFPVIALDKVIRFNPFWEEVAQGLKKRDVMVWAGQYVYTPDGEVFYG